MGKFWGEGEVKKKLWILIRMIYILKSLSILIFFQFSLGWFNERSILRKKRRIQGIKISRIRIPNPNKSLKRKSRSSSDRRTRRTKLARTSSFHPRPQAKHEKKQPPPQIKLQKTIQTSLHPNPKSRSHPRWRRPPAIRKKWHRKIPKIHRNLYLPTRQFIFRQR